MTSMFDQYRSTLRREDASMDAASAQKDPAPVSTSSGILSIRTTEALAMFATSRLNFKPIADIDHMAVSNNLLIVLMGNHVLRMTLSPNAPPVDEVKPLNAEYRVLKIFLDPQGSHLLLSVRRKAPGVVVPSGAAGHHQSELWYLNRSMQEPRKCDRFKGHEITAVGFNQTNGSDASTGAILLGTSRGLLFETELSCTDGDQRKVGQANWKQLPNYLPIYGSRDVDGLVFDIGKGEHCPITGIQLLKVPHTMRHVVFVTTLTRFYKFHEVIRAEEKSPYLHNIFNPYLNIPEEASDFQEIKHNLGHSSLRVFMNATNRFPSFFGWLTESCVLGGQMDSSSEQPDCVVRQERIPLPNADNTNGPISLVLTQFHALLLYKDHVTAISLLNNQTVYEEHFPDQHGELVDICLDQKSGRAYMCSRKAIFRFRINGEARNVWRIYLDQKHFDLARQFCQNPAQMDTVLVKQAEQLFEQEDYLGAASVYAQTRTSFEAVCLCFLKINQKEALMVFLRSRLESLRADQETQITMLVVWMVELYLTQIAELSFERQPSKARILQKEFEAFMKQPQVANKITSVRSVIYDLMASHGDMPNLRALTTSNRDFEVVINQHLNQAAYAEALAVLFAQNKTELIYKYAPILMEELPVQTGELIRSPKLKLDPEKLLPALMCVDTEDQRNEVMRYIEFSIHKNDCRCKALHNYAIKLYAAHNQPKLMPYFNTQSTDVSSVHYDVQYALRLCLQHNARPASVFLQCLLGLWHQAVELALTFDPKLAQETAARTADPALQRKLWLRIAEHAISGTDNVKQALRLLNECDGLLKIEDVLPFFSDFERIDHFKGAICDALKQYNEEISHQRSEMEASAASADLVRAELKSFRNRSVTISASEQCHTCQALLLSKPFFIFSCGHKFHADCLEQQVKAYLEPAKVQRLASLKQNIAAAANANAPTEIVNETNGSHGSLLDQLQAEYEMLLAGECFLCGHTMIECIDRPFIENWDRVVSEWL